MGKLTELLRNATSLRIITADKAESFERELLNYKQRAETLETENKSLRDAAITGQYDSSSGSISLFPSPYLSNDGPNTTRLFKKRNVRMLRNYAEYSVWVRAAIDIYRNVIEQAEWKLGPADSSLPINEQSCYEIQMLLENPSPTGTTYSTIKGQMIEDYLVLGHGVIEKSVNRDLTPYQLTPIDAAQFAFVPGWDGSDLSKPRYAQVDLSGSKVERWFANPMAMVMVNRPRTYDPLGLGHVEMLDFCVRSLLEGDDYLFNNVLTGSANGVLNLGVGVNKQQVDEFRQQLNASKRALAIIGGVENSSYIRFNGTEAEMRVLDTQVWFVRQIAAIFQLSTAALRLAVDQSRANTEAMLENDQEGPGALLWHMRQAENAALVKPFDISGHDNLILDYPIMSRSDAKQQAEISQIQTANTPWVTINEARRANGQPPIDMRAADEILVQSPSGLVPLSQIEQSFENAQRGSAGILPA